MTIIPHIASANEKRFIQYWKALRAAVARIEAIPPTKTQQLNIAVDNFFEMELRGDIELNMFEQNAIEIYTQKVYQHYEQLASQQQDINENNPGSLVNNIISEPQPHEAVKLYVPPVETQRIPLCCRKFFYKDEVLDESESLTLEYKDYGYPWSQPLCHTIKKTICGFLNRNGGILLIGITEDF